MSDTASGSRVGSLFGHYHLKRLLGHGGMSEVYEAEDTVKERTVALKLLSPVLSQDPAFRQRLHQEARAAGRLQEPHVVPIHDYGEIDGQLFLDMRLIQGGDLSALLHQTGKLPSARAVSLVRQAASALDAAHAAGVIHRDVKPQNILLTDDDFVYLVDFGIASVATADQPPTDTETIAGTWKYAAPELFTHTEVSHRIDVYALACVLYECLTGTPPYPDGTPKALVAAHLTKPIPRPSQSVSGIPPGFDAVIAKGMAKNAADRYASAGALANAAYQALNAPGPWGHGGGGTHRDAGAPPPVTPAYPGAGGGWVGHLSTLPTQRALPRKPRQALHRAAAALAVLLAAAGLIIWLTSRSRPQQPPAADTTTTGPVMAPSAPEPTGPPTDAQIRLLGLLPAGYPRGTCTPTTAPAGALAEVSCGINYDPDGPPSATYTLFSDVDALQSSFNTRANTSTVVTCPGRIQSPGPWHRAATPDKASGTLLCGLRRGLPTMVWTNDPDLLIGTVQADRDGPTLEQLYAWWSLHS